jgi:hypothetical protein
MRATLEVTAGPELGRTIRLGSKEVRSVGRTERADEALVADKRLSAVHFELETDHQVLRIRDLGSTNGTLVNGQPVSEYVLRSGDEVTAGDTTFRVYLEGGADSTIILAAQAAAAAAAPAVGLRDAGAPGAARKRPIAYTAETCNSGLVLYRGEASEIKPANVADALAREIPLFLLVDFRKLGGPPPDDLPSREYLFDWQPPEIAAATSPQFVAAADYPPWFALFDQSWGEDAVVAVFSRSDPVELRASLRRQVRPGGDAIVGLCWPSVLAPMLIYMRAEQVRPLLENVDAVLVELPDFPDTWQILAKENMADVLTKLGFVEVKTAES